MKHMKIPTHFLHLFLPLAIVNQLTLCIYTQGNSVVILDDSQSNITVKYKLKS